MSAQDNGRPVIVSGVRPALTVEQQLRQDVRELVEALREAECALSLMHSYGHCERDSYTGARDVAQVRAGDALERISALVAKHEGQA